MAATAILSGGLGLTAASEATAATAAGRPPQCVRVLKFYTQSHKRYVRLKNLCVRREACYLIVLPGRPGPRGRLGKGVTKNVSYGTDRGPRALYVKNTAC
ncbi:hypothetical protein [Streptomyces sp. NPDC003077]|uniref:hypothetical protein n=1 Tax=Streptomyces sp. NPDC003077 TaxID=3154443 RepID=UPI0033B48FAA